MDTLEALIEDVLDRLTRPDLVPLARKLARSTLFNLHALSNFHRDLTRTDLAAVTDVTTVIALPANFRKLAGVLAWDTDGRRVNIDYTPAPLEQPQSYAGSGQSVNIMFGLARLQPGYYLAGGSCKLIHAYPLPAQVQLEYYKLPTFDIAPDGAVSSDSWLLGQGYELVALNLQVKLAAQLGNKDLMSTLVSQEIVERVLMLGREQ